MKFKSLKILIYRTKMERTRHQVWRVLPPPREDEGSGKCRLSVGTMRAMGLSLAAPLVLRTPNKVPLRPDFRLRPSCPTGL
jgi:hypothetical protein